VLDLAELTDPLTRGAADRLGGLLWPGTDDD
jgi:hypothetical protein